jgi:hypothetical protein
MDYFHCAEHIHKVAKLQYGEGSERCLEWVTFRFKNSDTDQWKTLTLPAIEFIHRFLQHVLPKSFVKIRYYGLMAPSKRNLLAVAQYLLDASGATAENTSTVDQTYICLHCGGKMIWIQRLPKPARAPP